MADATELAGKADAHQLADAAAQLVECARKLSRASCLLPADEDFHFYLNFSEFQEPVCEIAARVHESFSKFSSLGILQRAPALPSDDDDLPDWLVRMQDELLEQVDSSFDLFKRERAQQGLSSPENDAFMYQNTRKKRRNDMPKMKEINSVPESGGKAVRAQVERCPVPFHVWSIPRPQDKFAMPVDNSNTPFRHPRPLSTDRRDAEPDISMHPLWEELQNMRFEDSLVGMVEVKKPASLEETPFTLVNTPTLLKDAVAKLALETEIAVDLEHHQYRSFQGLTCLMQISTRKEDFIIDTLELRSIIGQHLYEIFANSSIQKVMHGAGLDVTWLQRDFGIYVSNLFDTGQAARVLELESFGLAHLLTQFCEFIPDKRYQMADWRLRPLPVEMIKYAREDTHYLLYIADVLKQKLLLLQSVTNQKSLGEVLRRSIDICLKLYEKEITTESSYLQVYGLEARRFTSQQLAVLSGLYVWRDQIARADDESTGYVLPNHLLLKLAEEMPEDVKSLRTMLNGRHTIVARNSATIVNIIKTTKLLPQKIMIDGSPSLGNVINKPIAVFEEVPFPGTNTAETDVQGKRDNDHVSGSATCSSTGNADVHTEENTLRACSFPQFGMQIVKGTASDRVKLPMNASGSDSFTARENVCTSNSLGDVSASGVVVKRAGVSSLFSKAKKVSRVLQNVQDTVQTLGNEKLEVARAMRPEASSFGIEVDKFASLLGHTTSSKAEVKSSPEAEKFEQAAAKSRAESIRASFSLPFYAFDGGNSLLQRQRAGTAEQLLSEDKEVEPGKDITPALELQETEDVILLENNNDGDLEGGIGEAAYTVIKDVGITSDGVQHRLWWPNITGSGQEPSLDKMQQEPCDTSISSIMHTRLPSPLSQKFRKQRGTSQNSSSTSQFSTYNANDLQQEKPTLSKHTTQVQAKVTPFDYETANKHQGLCMAFHEIDKHLEGSTSSEPTEVSKEGSQRVFDPDKKMRELKSDDITPGKRRQVFPQSGNRTGVFM